MIDSLRIVCGTKTGQNNEKPTQEIMYRTKYNSRCVPSLSGQILCRIYMYNSQKSVSLSFHRQGLSCIESLLSNNFAIKS